MYNDRTIALLIPARNESLSLPVVLSSIPSIVDRILVLDNGSTDDTAGIARDYDAEVISEPRPGYGQACLAGMAALMDNPPDVVVFADADGSDDLSHLADLIDPIISGQADFVLANRIPDSPKALTLQQRIGNRFAVRLIFLFWGYRYMDLGPMRALTWDALLGLQMKDNNFGWTVEMQIKALQSGLRIKETALPYRPRIAGYSKISGTLNGILRAGTSILWVIAREASRERWDKLKNAINHRVNH